MRKISSILAVLTIVALLATSASASLMQGTHAGYPVMVDSLTGLNWLTLPQTVDEGTSTGAPSVPGFAVATDAEIKAMFADAGLPPDALGRAMTPSQLTSITNLVSLWGATTNFTGEPSCLFYDADQIPYGNSGVIMVGAVIFEGGTVWGIYTPADQLATNFYPPTPNTGWAMVATGVTIPEPSTIIIWSLLGAVGLGIGCWRRRKAA